MRSRLRRFSATVKWKGITGKALLMGEATVHPPSNLIYTNSTYGTLKLHVNESLTINGKW